MFNFLFVVNGIHLNLQKHTLVQDEAQEAIGAQREGLQEEISGLNTRAAELQDIMTQLKGDLYAKFGNNINLEPEEE